MRLGRRPWPACSEISGISGTTSRRKTQGCKAVPFFVTAPETGPGPLTCLWANRRSENGTGKLLIFPKTDEQEATLLAAVRLLPARHSGMQQRA
jgi:hypothetical protein